MFENDKRRNGRIVGFDSLNYDSNRQYGSFFSGMRRGDKMKKVKMGTIWFLCRRTN